MGVGGGNKEPLILESCSFAEFGSLPDTMEFVARLEGGTEIQGEIEDEESCYGDSSDGNGSEALL